ncbi:hypothetical protein QF037_009752 [Streptomyces canus]|nr:hypothetical protein [Streptomyces canus]
MPCRLRRRGRPRRRLRGPGRRRPRDRQQRAARAVSKAWKRCAPWRTVARPGEQWLMRLGQWKASTMPASMPSSWSLPEPMRAVPVNDPALPAGWAAQPKWDGYRALAGRWADGRVAVRSRNGSDLSAAFPEIEEAVRRLPDDTAVDCELIVWEAGRLAFERLQQRMHHRDAAAARAALEFPAHLVAFDLLRVHGSDLTGRPFSDRYAAPESRPQSSVRTSMPSACAGRGTRSDAVTVRPPRRRPAAAPTTPTPRQTSACPDAPAPTSDAAPPTSPRTTPPHPPPDPHLPDR